MEFQPDLKKLKRGVFSQLYPDGLLEIMLGVSMIALGCAFQAPLMSVFLLLPLYPGIKLLEKVKVRFSYPRTGFVSLRKEDCKPNHWISQIYILSVFSTYSLMVYLTGGWDDSTQWAKWSPYLIGGAGSGVSLAAFRFYRLPRHYLYAATGIALGVFLSLVKSPSTILQGGPIWSLWYGVIMLAIGCASFIRFLIKYKPRSINEHNAN